MFPRRTKNTLKQFRKDTLEEKWPEVREAKKAQGNTGKNTLRKRRNPQKWQTDKVPYKCFTGGKGRSLEQSVGNY